MRRTHRRRPAASRRRHSRREPDIRCRILCPTYLGPTYLGPTGLSSLPWAVAYLVARSPILTVGAAMQAHAPFAFARKGG